jgi:hypothetical protein
MDKWNPVVIESEGEDDAGPSVTRSKRRRLFGSASIKEERDLDAATDTVSVATTCPRPAINTASESLPVTEVSICSVVWPWRARPNKIQVASEISAANLEEDEVFSYVLTDIDRTAESSTM